MEETAPTLADFRMVDHDEIHYVGQLFAVQLAAIVCKNASAVTREPNLRRAGGGSAFRHVDVYGLAVLCGPEKDSKPLEEKDSRHMFSMPRVPVEA